MVSGDTDRQTSPETSVKSNMMNDAVFLPAMLPPPVFHHNNTEIQTFPTIWANVNALLMRGEKRKYPADVRSAIIC